MLAHKDVVAGLQNLRNQAEQSGQIDLAGHYQAALNLLLEVKGVDQGFAPNTENIPTGEIEGNEPDHPDEETTKQAAEGLDFEQPDEQTQKANFAKAFAKEPAHIIHVH